MFNSSLTLSPHQIFFEIPVGWSGQHKKRPFKRDVEILEKLWLRPESNGHLLQYIIAIPELSDAAALPSATEPYST
jgi:hypothetical protein